MDDELVWSDRKRWLFGLPWTFTKYTLTREKVLIRTGLFSTHEEEVRLYRILDLTLTRSLGERMFGLGTIRCNSADKTAPEFAICRVKDSERVKGMLSDLIEQERMAKRVSGREFMADGSEEFDREE